MSASELFDALVTALNPQGIAVYYGSGKPQDAYPTDAAVYITHASVADDIAPPKHTQTASAAQCVADVDEALTLRIEGSSTIAGATYRDHHDAVRAIRDRVICAVYSWARSVESNYEVGRCGWDDSEAEVPTGATYVMAVTIADHVYDTAPDTADDLPWAIAKQLTIGGTDYPFDDVPVPVPAP